MVTIIEAISLVTGIGGLLIGIISIIGQKKLETRIREKEKLKALSIGLKDLIYKLEYIITDIKDPTNNTDLFENFHLLSQAIIAKAFDEKKDIIEIHILIVNPFGRESDTSKGNEEGKDTILIEKKEDIIKANYKFYRFSIYAYLEENIHYSLSNHYVHFTPSLLEDLEILEKEYDNLIEEFSTDLLKNLKECIKEMVMTTIDSAIKSKKLEVNIKDFNKSDDISLWIYKEAIGRNKLDPYLNKLENLKGELDNLREKLLTTSYT